MRPAPDDAERLTEALRRHLGPDALLEALPIGICCCDAEGVVRRHNRRAAEIWGTAPAIGATGRFTGAHRLFWPDGRTMAPEAMPVAETLRTGKAVRDRHLVVERPDGTRTTVLVNVAPLRDDAGRTIGAVECFHERSGSSHQAEAHLAAIVSSSDDAIVSKSLDSRVRSWNAGATRIFGYTAEEMIGQSILKLIPPDLHHDEDAILARIRRGERIEHFETVRVAKDGRRIDVSLTVSPIHDEAGRVIGASKVARDISERKRADALQQLLVGELNHRVKNTLATVQAMATQTIRRAASPAEFVSSFSGRLQSLARTHDLLTQSSWGGADLQVLARDQLAAGGPDAARFAIAGPQVTLEPQAALHIALILHELGTNARKHGALSTAGGSVALRWEVRRHGDSELLLHWRESGGPPVAPPTSHGFGTTLIEKSLAAHGGSAVLHYRPEGIACDITLPLPEHTGSVVYQAPGGDAAEPPRPAHALALRGRRILVVEDEALIALDIAATFEDAGCTVIGPAATLQQARSLIAHTNFDVALLDANLDGEPVDELAAALTRRQIPFAFLTGYGPEALPPGYRSAALIRKPFMARQAIEAVGRLLADGDKVVNLRPKSL